MPIPWLRKPGLAPCGLVYVSYVSDHWQFLEKELNKLRDQFVKLPNSASEEQKLACVQACVEALNELDEQEDVEGSIDTDEREILCDFIYQMGDIVGLDGETHYVDEWRDW